MATRRESQKVYSQAAEPTQYASALTPEGEIQSYGRAFRSMRSTNPRRRRAAILFTVLLFLPIAITAVGWGLVLLRSL